MQAATEIDDTPPRTIEAIAASLTAGGFHQRPHLDTLAELLEQAVRDVAAGGTRRIVISLPPGSGKSLTCSVALPVHILAHHPSWNIGIICSEQSLAAKFSRDAKREAPLHGVQIARGVAGSLEWECQGGGGVIARGVGGALTGRRISVLIQDDLYRDARVAYSERERDNIWSWYQSVGKTRLAPASLALNVQTRWHENDHAGRLLEQGWEEFRLPALAEDQDPIGRAVGEPLLTPQADETPQEALERWARVREEVGAHVWAGLYQQRPAPAGGSIFNADQLADPPDGLDLEAGTWVTSWDLSFGGGGDYTVGTVWQRCKIGKITWYVLHDLIRGRWEFTDQKTAITRTATRYPQCTRHLVEKAANGAAMVDVLKDDLPTITPVKPLGGKVERWQAVTPLMEAGVVATMGGAWMPDLVGEMVVAPNGKFDDCLDSYAMGLNWLRPRRGGVIETQPPQAEPVSPLRAVRF